jgi:DNA-binding HxlR family transcriptional regulator
VDTRNELDAPPSAGGNCFNEACPGRTILSHVTGRWGSLVLAGLASAGTLRFSELRTRIQGVSEKMLSQTLRELERDGLLERRSYAVVPPRVEYSLTPLGTGVAAPMAAAIDWIDEHVRDLVASQSDHDARHAKSGR